MTTYIELADKVTGDRHLLAVDLARELDAMNTRLCKLDVIAEEEKEYLAIMRIFLATQKQFAKLLPVNIFEGVDALTAFNAGK